MSHVSHVLTLADPAETDALGARLARIAQTGDCILLKGQIGAGKSALARAFIRTLLGCDTDVPSPTFTLVQTYPYAEFEIWHADLYRLSDPTEVIELGLVDAFETGVCLIEWPELLADLAPTDALEIEFLVDGEGRIANLTFGPAWAGRLTDVVADAG